MTNQEAEIFTARWRRILIPWQARTDAEAVRDMESSCAGIVLGMTVISAALAIVKPFTSSAAVAAAGFMIATFAVWLTWRLHLVRRLFDVAAAQSFSDLKRK